MTKEQWHNLIKELGWWKAYPYYLSSSSWKQKRKERLEIDKRECRTCGNKESLQIHHKPQAYKDIPNESVINDLITLCEGCHQAITSFIRQRRYQNRDIKIQFYQSPREGKELQSYGMEDSTIQTQFVKRPDHAQRRVSQSDESDSEINKIDLWKTEQDRGRFNGIG